MRLGDTIDYRAGPGNDTQHRTVSGFARSPAYPAASIIGQAIAYAPARDVRRMYNGEGDNLVLVRLKDFEAWLKALKK